MRTRTLLPVLLLGLIAASSLPTPRQTSSTVTGDYVEARTASVFAGPCHFNGELVTEGKQAMLAWNIQSGKWNGIDLAGVRAMASISSDNNLSDSTAAHHYELIVDRSATDAQAAAMADLIQNKAAAQLGTRSAAPRRANISFTHDSDGYTVSADGFGDLTVHPMPNNQCCTEPHLVWYTPLSPIQHRKVGYTEAADYTAGTNGEIWQRSDENSAFYGSFAFSR